MGGLGSVTSIVAMHAAGGSCLGVGSLPFPCSPFIYSTPCAWVMARTCKEDSLTYSVQYKNKRESECSVESLSPAMNYRIQSYLVRD